MPTDVRSSRRAMEAPDQELPLRDWSVRPESGRRIQKSSLADDTIFTL